MHELQIPPAAKTDPNAREIARIWGANKSQHVTLASGLWKDPGAWGIVLADLMQHVANFYEQQGSYSRADALARVKEVFELGSNRPTDEATGTIDN